jgi:hypothetical protein
MKKLIAAAVLGLSFGVSSLSFASDYMDLYTNGPAAHELTSESNGGVVETSPMSFYLSPVKVSANSETVKITEKTVSSEYTLLVFGVRI